MAAGLTVIFFLCTLVVWTIWTMIYSIFVAHYFLTTLADSSSGQDEIHYPKEGIFDWWSKPVFLAWLLFVWLIPVTLLLTPLAFISGTAFAVTWLVVLWFLYPLGIMSAMYTQNWLLFVHRGVLERLFRHYPAFAYTHVVTFALFGGCVWLVGQTVQGNVVCGVLAAVLAPAALLLCARHWGRFAWLALNYLPWHQRVSRPKRKRRREERSEAETAPVQETPQFAAAPPMDGIKEGPPSALPTGIQASMPSAPSAEPAPPAAEVDEWTDLRPYAVLDDPALPTFKETLIAPAQPTPEPALPAVVDEEEDEWATDKKPYTMTEDVAKPGDTWKRDDEPEANKPIVLHQYYAARATKEAQEAKEREAAKYVMPPPSKKTPTFNAALGAGVWGFMLHSNTLAIWGNLIVLTMIELFILFMLVQFAPKAG